MTYRADPLSQRDGSALANSNCRPTSIAVGLDYQESGAKKSTGAKMRGYMDDQSGGTDSSDARQAWDRGYDESLTVRDGNDWNQVIRDLESGRAVHIDVWHASVGGPCISGSGAYGHTMIIAPERSGSRWLVCDPWCSPPKWTWTEESRLRAGAEEWGRRIFKSTEGGKPLTPVQRIIAMRAKAKLLMTLFRPGHETPPSFPTGGNVRSTAIMFTVTSAGSGGSQGMAIGAASGLVSGYRVKMGQGRDFFADPNLTDRLGELSKDATVYYIGNALGESVPGGSKAVLVTTGTAYSDGVARPTVVYVASDAFWGEPEPVPPPDTTPPSDAEIAAAIEARDDEWHMALMNGFPWPSEE